MKKIATVFVFGLLFAANASYAEWVQGIVSNVDIKAGTIQLNRLATDKNKDFPQTLQLNVQRDAKLKNIVSLEDLKKGNHIKVDVKQNKDLGIWEAKAVELSGDPATQEAPAAY